MVVVAFIFIVQNTKPIYNISYAIQQAAGGPGIMLYSYISTATAAYIFSACDANGLELERQRDRSFVLDKRHIVTLARKTHTWRIFPLPILRMDEEMLNIITIATITLCSAYKCPYSALILSVGLWKRPGTRTIITAIM